MSNLDVEALLDATANGATDPKPTTDADDQSNRDRSERKERDRERERDHDRRRRERRDSASRSHRGTPDDHKADTPRSDAGSHKKMATTTAAAAAGAAAVRAPVRARRTGRAAAATIATTGTVANGTATAPTATLEIIVQLAARLRTRELKEFFEKVGPVNEAQIVKDRISQRSKGVGYVEFKSEDTVTQALQLTGQKLLGIPIIVQLTEAEKNRQVRTTEAAGTQSNSIPFHRLYVGNIHFNVTEQDLQAVFEPFGELEFVQLQKDDTGRSRGYGFVQYRDAGQAREALEKMNGFDLAGRPIRVGLGNDKFTPESTANLLQRFSGREQPFQGSAFSGAGGRGPQNSTFDRAGGRDSEKSGGAIVMPS
ncbi:RNA-binding protein rsd1 like [Verticillium longisporum]|uniref:RNA-binding protein rsd1 like n=2 Tax=Verticillium longisporum TaxID=100787 RepID=A0A8I2Z8V4_VERLO|nr:RNA-binding protein rsd1 like [Verticillium longisporum]